MKPRFFLFVVGLAAALLMGCGGRGGPLRPAACRIAITTPAEAEDPESYRGAEALVAAYGSAAEGGAVVHAVLSLGAKPSGVSSFIADLATDSRIAAIVVSPAPEGSAAGFRKARRVSPNLVLIAAQSSDDRLEIEATADLVVELDRLYRPYFAAMEARSMGAASLVEAAFEGAQSSFVRSREEASLRAACGEFGLSFSRAAAPAATAGLGTAWLGKLDRRTALYCSEARLAEPVFRAALGSGALVVDAGPSSLGALGAALNLPASGERLDGAWPTPAESERLGKKELKQVEAAAEAKGATGRISTWTSGYAGPLVEGAGELALRAVSKKNRTLDLAAFTKALEARSPSGAWIAAYDADPGTGVRSANHILVRQDPFVLGKGYMQSALKSIPARYLALGPGEGAAKP